MEEARHYCRNRRPVSKKDMCSFWGDKLNKGQLKIGNELKIDFDIEIREYNGKWYTDIKASKIESAISESTPHKLTQRDIDELKSKQSEGDDGVW